jgi:large subunit ribosomal protein L32
MANPKRKHSKTRRDTRRAHDGLKPVHSIACDNCGAHKAPHRVCSACGYYKGKQVLAVRVSAD